MTTINYVERKKPRIRLLESCFAGGEGDIFNVEMETDDEIYFTDCNGRWCYFWKSEEGTAFEWKRRPSELTNVQF